MRHSIWTHALLSATAVVLTGGIIIGCTVHGSVQSGERKTTSMMVAPQAAAAPAQSTEKYTYVVCHGAWAGGFEWKMIAERLAKDGHLMYRPTYTGNGERSHLSSPDLDLNTHITDITNVILFENLRNVILVGHSYGGMVATGVADRIPERIKAVVYVDAFVPENGESLNTAGEHGRTEVAEAVAAVRARVAATRPGGGATTRSGATTRGGTATRGGGRGNQVVNGFTGAATRPGQRPPYNVPQSAKTFSQPIELKNPDATKKIPVVYLLTVDAGAQPELDSFYPSSQRAKARGWTTWQMESDHVPSMTHPAELTKLLEEAPAAAKATVPN